MINLLKTKVNDETAKPVPGGHSFAVYPVAARHGGGLSEGEEMSEKNVVYDAGATEAYREVSRENEKRRDDITEALRVIMADPTDCQMCSRCGGWLLGSDEFCIYCSFDLRGV